MARAGYCSECGGNVWLDEAGGCTAGHPADCISGIYEVEQQPSPQSVEPKRGFFSKIGDALAGSAKTMTPEEVELRKAELEHAAAVKAAEKNLKTVRKSAERDVRDAEKHLREAQAYGTRKVDWYQGVTLYENKVVTPQGTIDLEREDASATVDTAGALMETRRSTLTRMATGGILLGPVGLLAGGMMKKKGSVDTRELYLVVESQSIASIVECKPDDGAEVRTLAAAINTTSKGAAARAEKRAQLVADWTENLEVVRDESAASVAQAEAELTSVQSDTAKIDAARAAVAAHSSGSDGRAG